ncbi:hypothetical protein [Streptomyces sp. NRRL F-525]|uniref:hypothetical protein n=1 Tax=Streptomyces sp. NRRL F-525 TaxID=1463861 RepID=UPI0005267E46|nr:hypothetical protein [Streptomyces sp. NRRL F-525]
MRAAVRDGAGGWGNAYPDTVKLEEADTVRPVAMYVACRRRRWAGEYRYVLVPFDLDASRGRDQVQADAQALAQMLAAHGIASVPVRSGPSGGVHLWTACPAGLAPDVARALGQLAARLYPSVDPTPLQNPVSGALRPPGAAHRSGHGHAELDGLDVRTAVAVLRKGSPAGAFWRLLRTLEALTAAPALLGGHTVTRSRNSGQHVPPSIARRGPVIRDVEHDDAGHVRLRLPWRPLGARALETLRRRPDDAPGAHQAAVHHVLVRCALAGWTYAQTRTLVEDATAAPALEWLRTTSTAGSRSRLPEVEAERRLTRRWWLAVQEAARLPARYRDRPRAEEMTEGAAAAADLLARIEAAGTAPWRRPSGPADLAVLRSLAYLMAVSGSAEVSANVRRLAVLSGRSKATAALSLGRLEADGWTTTTQTAVPGACRARRITTATGHTCPDDPHHICAVHHIAAGQRSAAGSDRSDNAAPHGGHGVTRLELLIVHQQSGVWHEFGHHAGRTLEALQQGVRGSQLSQATGYTPETLTRHLDALTAVGLLVPGTHRRTDRTLYEAAAQLGQAGRPAELAVSARVDEERHRWWLAEQEWCAAPRGAKPRQADRPHPRQTVLPGMDPYERRYPRHPHHSTHRTGTGLADHATAWEIEAQRIGAAALLAEACEIERHGGLVDPALLGRQHDPSQSLPEPEQAAA